MDVTTLGRGGSDTTAVAVAAALKAKNCYIYSDVDGVYTTDPNKIKEAQKLNELSYTEMKELSNEGAKVLHNRSVEIAEKFKISLETLSTFTNNAGTHISDSIEENSIKSIIKKDISRISIIGNGIIRNINFIKEILDIIEKNKLNIIEFTVTEYKITIMFKDIIKDDVLSKIHKIIFN